MGRVTARKRVLHIEDGVERPRSETLAAEEPLEIRVNGRPLTVTMRTPGHDFELAAGFLASEGVIHASDDILNIRYCAGAVVDDVNTYNVVDVQLAAHVPEPAASLERNFYTTSSCGVCGKASLEAVRTVARWGVAEDDLSVSAEFLTRLPVALRESQQVFEHTGGLHAAGLFNSEGELLCSREDVGRHNAVDKVVGWALLQGLLPLRGTVLMVSGRASFELVQKALMAGIPALAAVSAPSSLAVDLAHDSGLTLVGFLRGQSMNVYAGQQRVATRTPASQ